MNGKNQFLKKAQARKLQRFPELNALNISWAASFSLALLLLFNSFDWELKGFIVDSPAFYVAALYLIPAGLSLSLSICSARGIARSGAIPVFVRRISLLLAPFALAGNIFAAIAGFTTVKKSKSLEYQLLTCAFLNNLMVIMTASLNFFKDSLPDYFAPAISALAFTLAFYLAAMAALHRAQKTGGYKRLYPIAFASILTAATGNIFALILGLAIISKIRSSDSNRTIEWIETLRRIFRNYMAVLGMLVIIFLVTLSVCSIFTFDYAIATTNDYSNMLKPPSLAFPFGTDDVGRCVFTRIVFGARISLFIGIIATAIPLIAGGFLGSVAGNYGSKLDNGIMRILDIFHAVPSTLLTIAIVAAFGASTFNLIIALSLSNIPVYARTMRAQVMVVSNNEFVEAARACGRRKYEILFKHIIPNSLAPMIVRASVSIGIAVLSTSSLSYLGLGVEPKIPEWGNILKVGSKYLETNPYLAVYPGIFIIILVLAFNFLGDGLRDALDPKMK
ncbi:MAG: ABC transporter permease [Clostridiales bacterium]|jgi:peptide/nickel transport system permease protein|nr:ABC transporter permease [Clostridiales bacterium]